MDGILILGLVGWVILKMSKKNQKTKAKPALGIQKENAAQRRAERLARMHAELEKRRAQLTQEKQQAEPPAMSEGESSSAYTVMEETFRGSMQVESTEGECICDPELEHERKTVPEPESVYAGEIGREPLVDFSSHGVLQGIVMSEILTRPCQRTRR